MITTFLIEHPWLSPTALALLVILGPLVGRLIADRPGTAWLLTGLGTLPVVVLTMLPTERRAFERCEVAWTLPTVGRVELAANVVLFVAPALFASVATRRPVLVLVAASALSALIETAQALAPMIGRSCSTNDWLSNTIGVAIGVLLAMVTLRLAGPLKHAERPNAVIRDRQ
ncbi:VanZ family protein [Streptomonospora alba]|uniref:VanZ family protein n=1 Tax=Streptomonospora alba TaxID=183763 RepID=UPI00069B86F9|nr:VanZ family protein [Streptomonospora alba]